MVAVGHLQQVIRQVAVEVTTLQAIRLVDLDEVKN